MEKKRRKPPGGSQKIHVRNKSVLFTKWTNFPQFLQKNNIQQKAKCIVHVISEIKYLFCFELKLMLLSDWMYISEDIISLFMLGVIDTTESNMLYQKFLKVFFSIFLETVLSKTI